MRVAFLGDFALFKTGVISGDWKEAFSEVEKELRMYDLVVANLEEPLTDRARSLICKGIHIKGDRRIVEVLKYLHVKVVCLANNHICDYGLAGMRDTIKVLEEAGIGYYGINGKNWTFQHENTTVTFHGFCCYSTNGAKYIESERHEGVNALKSALITSALEADKKRGAFSCLSLHWGDEYSHLPNRQQVEFTHHLSENFSFVIQGHHTHIMQGIEEINDSLVAYSQGNFYFEDVQSEINPRLRIKQGQSTREGFILCVEISDNLLRAWRTVGISRDNCNLHLVNNETKLKELSSKIASYEEESYRTEAKSMIDAQKGANRGKHNLRWFFSKLNYYSIGAEIKSHYYRKKYNMEYR